MDKVLQKTLRRRLMQLGQERRRISKYINQHQQELSEIKSKIAAVNQPLKDLETSHIEVSDHAVLRYLERVKGLDVGTLRAEILPESVWAQVLQLGGAIVE